MRKEPDNRNLAKSIPLSSPRSQKEKEMLAISIKSDGGNRPNPFLVKN